MRAEAPSEGLCDEFEHQNLALFATLRLGDCRNALNLDQQTLDLVEATVMLRCGVDAQVDDAERSNAHILPKNIFAALCHDTARAGWA